jgi:tetratricopeptide (TPR) repeat protein
VTAVAVVTGFGLTLLIARETGHAPQNSAAARTAPAAPASAAIARGPAPTVPVAKAAAVERAPVRELAPALIAERSSEPQVPTSTRTVPGCREMLGDDFVEKADPNAALAETQVGNRELVRGKVDASQAAFCKAALWDSAKVERWLNLAQIFLIRGDGNQAVESSGRALELDPKNARALELQGDAFARLGKLKEARIAYLAAEARPGSDEDALKWLVRRDLDEASRSLKAREFVRAERLFRRVVAFDPAHAAAAIGVATCLRKQNDRKAADEWERHAELLVRNKNP